jgi:hypothetical protein
VLSYLLKVSFKSFEANLLNQGSCLAGALGVTKFIKIRDMILIPLYFANLGVQQTHL